MTSFYHHLDNSPRGQIIKLLQRNGPMGIKAMRLALGVSDTAIRQHLNTLLADGLIQRTLARSGGRGRPSTLYTLADKARHLFACESQDLALALYDELLKEFGPDTVRTLLDRVAQRMAADYRYHVRGLDLQERVKTFSLLLDSRGIMSDVSEHEQGVMLHEYNCPYQELATAHADVCALEEKMLADVLGAEVKLTQTIVGGHHRCSFIVHYPAKSAA
jgi:predicted ArsR family transcriptional regulator